MLPVGWSVTPTSFFDVKVRLHSTLTCPQPGFVVVWHHRSSPTYSNDKFITCKTSESFFSGKEVVFKHLINDQFLVHPQVSLIVGGSWPHLSQPTLLLWNDYSAATSCSSSWWQWLNSWQSDIYLLTCVKRFAAVGRLTDLIREPEVGCGRRGRRLLPLWKPLLFNNPQKSIVSYMPSDDKIWGFRLNSQSVSSKLSRAYSISPSQDKTRID